MSRSGPRKLLLHQREIEKMIGAVERKGMTLIPLSIYFNGRGRAKSRAGAGEGQADPRQAPDDQGPRLAARQGAADARERIERFTSRNARARP
jgi:tmRNA-binding protein